MKNRHPRKHPVDLLIFDLDGTLIESKWDIADSVQRTLADLSLPPRTQEEIFGFVGDGIKRLLRLAVGEDNQARYEDALRIFRGYYMKHCLDRTRYYPGLLAACASPERVSQGKPEYMVIGIDNKATWGEDGKLQLLPPGKTR